MNENVLDNISNNPNMILTQKQFEEVVDALQEDVLDDDYVVELDGDLIQPNVKSLVYGMKTKVKKKYSQVGILSSMKMNGMGKSSLGYWMGREIDRDDFSFERNFFFRGGLEDIVAKTDALPSGSFLFMDEMLRAWYKRRAMSRGVVDLNEWMGADQRKTEVIFFGAMPDFWDLDSYARDGKVDYYVETLARGVGILLKADHFPGVSPWHPDELKKIHDRRVLSSAKTEHVVKKIELMERHPCYVRPIFWCAMPKNDEREYLRVLKESAKSENIDDMKSEYEKAAEELEYKHQTAHVKSYTAVVNLMNMLKLRGVSESRLLRESGLDKRFYFKMKRDLKKFKESPPSKE